MILGTLTIPLTYFLGKKVAGNDVGIIAAFFVTFSFFEIGWSRQARMYQMYQFFFLFAITAYAYFKIDYKSRYAFLLLLGIIGAYFSHATWKILPPILLIDVLFTNSVIEDTSFINSILDDANFTNAEIELIVTITEGIPIVTVELPRSASRLGASALWARYGEMLLTAIRFAE